MQSWTASVAVLVFPNQGLAIFILITFTNHHGDWPFSLHCTSLHQDVFSCLALQENFFVLGWWKHPYPSFAHFFFFKHYVSSLASVNVAADISATIPILQVFLRYSIFRSLHINKRNSVNIPTLGFILLVLWPRTCFNPSVKCISPHIF